MLNLRSVLMAGSMLAGLSAPALAADPVYPVYPQQAFVTPTMPAANPFSAIFDLHGGYLWGDSYSDDYYDGAVFGGSGRLNVWLGDSVSMQFDADIEASSDADGGHYTSYGAAGHLTWRNPESYAAGVFASVGKMAEDNVFGTVGLEAQRYMGNFTLYGQVGLLTPLAGTFAWNDDYDAAGMYAFLEGRYFVKPNLMVAGHVALDYIGGHGGSDYDTTAFRYGLEIEYKHDNSPFAAFASLEGATGTWADETISDVTVLGGLKLVLGEGTLQRQNNYGVTLEDNNPMYGPNRIRAIAWE